MSEECNELQKNFDALKRIHDSTNRAVEALDKELVELRRINGILEAEKKQWEIERSVQQNIFQQTLDKVNAQNNVYLEELTRLRDEP